MKDLKIRELRKLETKILKKAYFLIKYNTTIPTYDNTILKKSFRKDGYTRLIEDVSVLKKIYNHLIANIDIPDINITFIDTNVYDDCYVKIQIPITANINVISGYLRMKNLI